MKIAALTVCCLLSLYAQAYARVTDVLKTDFKKADSIAALYPKHSLLDLRVLANKLTLPLSTEEEKFRAIYKWVCNNIEYDYPVHQQNQQKRKKLEGTEDLQAWNKKISAHVIKTLLNKQRSVCSGYAYLVKELAYYAGISCEVIDGYGRTAQANIRGTGTLNHSWNAVQLHGKWYLCDPTWSSGAYDVQLLQYVRSFTDSYFLADPSLFVRNHYPLDSAWMLLKHKPTLHEFLNGPLIYRDAYVYAIDQLSPETFDILATKGKKISFQFMNTSEKAIAKIELTIKGPGTVNTFTPEFYQDQNGLYNIDHIFTGKGTYIVHILLDNNYVVTYTVNLK